MRNSIFTAFILVFFLTSCSEKAKWNTVLNENTIESYENFLEKYPDSEYKNEAKERVVDIEYANAKNNNSIEGYKDFLKKYPNSKHTDNANKVIIDLEFENVKQINTISEYETFLKKYPNSSNVKEANLLLEEIKDYQYIITNSNYKKYLKDFAVKYRAIYNSEIGINFNSSLKDSQSMLDKGRKELQSYLSDNIINEKDFDMVNMLGCCFTKYGMNKNSSVSSLEGISLKIATGVYLDVIMPQHFLNLIISSINANGDKNQNNLKNAIYDLIDNNRKFSDDKLETVIKKWANVEQDSLFKSKLEKLLVQ